MESKPNILLLGKGLNLYFFYAPTPGKHLEKGLKCH